MVTAAKQQKKKKGKIRFTNWVSQQKNDVVSLNKQSLIFFSLAVVLTLIVAACVLYDNSFTKPVYFLVLVSLTLLLITLIGGMILFQRNIVRPLENIGESVWKMTEGHLDQPIHIQTRDEIAKVAEGINGLVINLQEVLLFVWNHTQHNFTILGRSQEQMDGHGDGSSVPTLVKKDIAQALKKNKELQEVVTTFDYFEVNLEDEKLVSDPLHEKVQSTE